MPASTPLVSPLNRRRWLQRSSATLAGAFGCASLGSLLTARPAAAADYKALVCVFLYGGNDGMNTIVPTDASRYGQYAGVRGALALPKSGLVGLSGSDYGLHPSLSALETFWNQKTLAAVLNVGPLSQPLTKSQYLDAPEGSSAVPPSLFSHADQQLMWQSAGTDTVARTGWGGRASETLVTANPVISVSGNAVFGLESQRSPLVLPLPGQLFGASGLMPADLTWTPRKIGRAHV